MGENRNIRAVKYTITKKHNAAYDPSSPWESDDYSSNETRYRIEDAETGEVLDDAQGYGYRTAQKAYAGYAYKNRDKSKDRQKVAKKAKIQKWMKENKSFIHLMDACAFDIAKRSMTPEEFNATFVQKLLEENNLKPDFSAAELLKVWRGK